MHFRGPTLLLFGASLILSPLAIRLAEDPEASGVAAAFAMVGAADAECDRASVDLVGGQRIGCNRDLARREGGRVMEGGASFVVARR